MQTTIICGSHRPQSNSLKLAQHIRAVLTKKGLTEPGLISMADEPLPLWSEAIGDPHSELAARWRPLSEQLRASDSFVVISPEWSGMVPAGLKNFFLYASGGELAHKPGLICTVSAGTGGAYPVAELRMSSYKNSQICYLPEHIIVRQANDVLADIDPKSQLFERLDHALDMLLAYSRALTGIREQMAPLREKYPFGM